MKPKVLMIILDGFSSNYLQRDFCPNLYEMSKIYYFSKIEPMFGFQGVGAAIYSGVPPNVTGVFTEFIHKENEFITRSRFLKTLLRLTDKLPSDNLCANARNLLYKVSRKKGYGISNIIPSQLLGYFSPKLKGEFTEKNILRHIPTIFDILRENNMSHEIQRPAPRSEISTYNDTINRIQSSKIPDFLVLHPCSLDIVGHNFGPRSLHIKYLVKRIDEQIYRIIHSIQFSSEKIAMIILSDHGMSPVDNRVNLLNLVRSLPLKVGEDYLTFLDSTMARFWFFNDKARKLVCERLSMLEFGQILDEPTMEKLGIDNIGQEYGELIFALNEGHVIFPDFFRKYSPPKGMHGYAFPSYDAPILLVYAPSLSMNFERNEIVRFIDIMPTILELLDLPIPHTCEGRSVLVYD